VSSGSARSTQRPDSRLEDSFASLQPSSPVHVSGTQVSSLQPSSPVHVSGTQISSLQPSSPVHVSGTQVSSLQPFSPLHVSGKQVSSLQPSSPVHVSGTQISSLQPSSVYISAVHRSVASSPFHLYMSTEDRYRTHYKEGTVILKTVFKVLLVMYSCSWLVKDVLYLSRFVKICFCVKNARNGTSAR
jgi:hypothetical protein